MRFLLPFLLIAVLMVPLVEAQQLDVEVDGQAAGFQRVRVEVSLQGINDDSEIVFLQNGIEHSRFLFAAEVGENWSEPAAGEWYDDCWYSIDGTSTWNPVHRDVNGTPTAVITDVTSSVIRCDLTGFMVEQTYDLTVLLETTNETLQEALSVTATTEDVIPPPPDTTAITYAIGSILLSVFTLFMYLRWKDRESTGGNGLLLVLPAILALALLSFYPIGYGIALAFTDAHEERIGDEEFNGFDNLVEVFTSSGFLRVMLFTLIWTFSNVFFHILLGGALAMLLQQQVRGKVAYRTILLLPWAIPSYISVLVWKGMFHPEGLVNDILGTEVDFFSNLSEAQIMVILVNIWLGVPFMMMSISGSLQSIPKELHEAAEVEGVDPLSRLRHITIPLLKPTVIPLALMGFIWTFNMFNVIFLLTGGGPNLWIGEAGGTDILITYVYDVAFVEGELGLAAAWSVIIFLMLMAFSWTYARGTRATEAIA